MIEANLWTDTAPRVAAHSALAGELDVDLAIIGGGYTGCSAALHAAGQGARVCVLEAATIGHGGSGRNVGLVNAGLWITPAQVECELGVNAGRRLNETLAAGPAQVFGLIEAHRIECEAVRAGTLHCAHSKRGFEDLRERYRQQRERDAPVELLSAADVERLTGTARYHGALLDRRAGTIQPLLYCRGLARAAQAGGAYIYEGTPVTAIDRKMDGWCLSTPAGRVRAAALLMCTNAYHRSLAGTLSPRFVTLSFFQVATRPLDDASTRAILPERQGCWDTALVMSSFRRDAAGRLILGAVGSLGHLGGFVHYAWARRKLRDLFPAIAHCDFEHAWYGRIAMTCDRIPRIVEIGPNAICVYGYNGRGISPGIVFGRAAAEYLLTSDPDVLPVTISTMPGAVGRHLKTAGYETGAMLWHVIAMRGFGI